MLGMIPLILVLGLDADEFLFKILPRDQLAGSKPGDIASSLNLDHRMPDERHVADQTPERQRQQKSHHAQQRMAAGSEVFAYG